MIYQVIDRKVIYPCSIVPTAKLILNWLEYLAETRRRGTLILLTKTIHRNSLKIVDSSDDILNRRKLIVRISSVRSWHKLTQVAAIRNFGTPGSNPVNNQTEIHGQEFNQERSLHDR